LERKLRRVSACDAEMILFMAFACFQTPKTRGAIQQMPLFGRRRSVENP
jgi:hypothetical protein